MGTLGLVGVSAGKLAFGKHGHSTAGLYSSHSLHPDLSTPVHKATATAAWWWRDVTRTVDESQCRGPNYHCYLHSVKKDACCRVGPGVAACCSFLHAKGKSLNLSTCLWSLPPCFGLSRSANSLVVLAINTRELLIPGMHARSHLYIIFFMGHTQGARGYS